MLDGTHLRPQPVVISVVGADPRRTGVGISGVRPAEVGTDPANISALYLAADGSMLVGEAVNRRA
ncbi:MAG: hypothetical protein ACRDSZ_08355 [Pseudonocardiaceae bacterium]